MSDDQSTNVLTLIGTISDESAKAIVADLYSIAGKVRHIVDGMIILVISGPGGDYYATRAIMDTIEAVQQEVPVVGRVHGRAMSGHSLVLQACAAREMSKNSWLGIHGVHSISAGDETDMAVEAAHTASIQDQIAALYASRSKRSLSYWRRLLQNDTMHYYSAQQALDEKMIDAVIDV